MIKRQWENLINQSLLTVYVRRYRVAGNEEYVNPTAIITKVMIV